MMNPSSESNSFSIPLARPDIGDAEVEAVNRVLRSGWLTTGAEAIAFESEFASAIGARHACAVSSATAGLHLCLEAYGVGRDDYVAVSPYTFASSAEVMRYLGAHPLFVDIEEDGYNICPDSLDSALEAAIQTGRTVRAVMPVHLAGRPCRMDRIRRSAARYDIAVIEDAAHAFPSTYSDGTSVGESGTAVFSFYANKPITTGEGGMVVSDNSDVIRRVKTMRLHGIDRTVWDRYRTPGAGWEYDLIDAGYKYNMPDLLAALGRVQLQRSSELAEKRRRLAAGYNEKLAGIEGLRLPPLSDGHAWHLYIVRVPPGRRNSIVEALAERGVATSVHYKPLHMMSYYMKTYGYTENAFPVSRRRFEESISLPLFPGLTEAEQEYVSDCIRWAVNRV